jgi:DNA-binding GntR family transcriptional regulator
LLSDIIYTKCNNIFTVGGLKLKNEFKLPKGMVQQIAEHIGSRIIHLELKPGERIFEVKLAAEMGVSRPPLREALRMLEASGLVEYTPRYGAKVSEMSEETILATAEVLKEIFSFGIRMGFQMSTAEDYEALKTAVESLREYAEIEDISGYLNATKIFAKLACRSTKNILLERIVLFFWPVTSRFQYISRISDKNGLKENVKYFERTLDYYQEGNPEMAGKTMADLIENELKNVIKYTREKGYIK